MKSNRRLLDYAFLMLLVSGGVALGGWWYVLVSSGFTKLWSFSALGAILSGGLGLIWRRRGYRNATICVLLIIGGLFLLPGSEMNATTLRDRYVKRMTGFEDTRYYWGGESRRGIDCSGLPRRAFRDALFMEGLRHLNGGSLRSSVGQWWHDASAKALMEGYRNYVVPLGISGTVRSVDEALLHPGDLAITSDGVHVMVFVSPGKWIQADPGENRVVILDPRISENGWFDSKVSMFRWSELAN